MSLRYCLECGEAVEVQHVITSFKEKMWGDVRFYGHHLNYCVNEDCKLYGVLMMISRNSKPKRKKK